MLEKLRHVQLTPQTVNAQTIAAMVAIYLVVLVCTLWSIFETGSRPAHRFHQWLWAAVVVAVPLIGILAYLPFSLKHEVFPFLGVWRRHH